MWNEIFSPFVCRSFVVNARVESIPDLQQVFCEHSNYTAHGHRQDSCDDHVFKETATSTADTTMLFLLLKKKKKKY